VKTIHEQTGWQRPFPKMLCNRLDVLLKIDEYSYNLDDKRFIKYFEDRTGIQISASKDWRFLYDGDNAKNYQFTHLLIGRPVTYEDRQGHLKHIKITRGKLQDAWELYTKWELDF